MYLYHCMTVFSIVLYDCIHITVSLYLYHCMIVWLYLSHCITVSISLYHCIHYCIFSCHLSHFISFNVILSHFSLLTLPFPSSALSNAYKSRRPAPTTTSATPSYGQSGTPTWAKSVPSAQSAPASAPAPTPKRTTSMHVITAVALFDYVAAAEDELSIKEGDVIELESKDPSGWWVGRVGGKRGLFPGNYAREMASGPIRSERANYPYGA